MVTGAPEWVIVTMPLASGGRHRIGDDRRVTGAWREIADGFEIATITSPFLNPLALCTW